MLSRPLNMTVQRYYIYFFFKYLSVYVYIKTWKLFSLFQGVTKYMHRSQSKRASRLTTQVYLAREGEEVGGVWRCTPVKACSKRLHTLSHTDARTHTEACRVVKKKKKNPPHPLTAGGEETCSNTLDVLQESAAADRQGGTQLQTWHQSRPEYPAEAPRSHLHIRRHSCSTCSDAGSKQTWFPRNMKENLSPSSKVVWPKILEIEHFSVTTDGCLERTNKIVDDLLPLRCHEWRNNILFSSHGEKDKTLNLELFLSHWVKTNVRFGPGLYVENLSFSPSLSQHTSSSSSLSDSSAGCVQIGPLRAASRARSRSVRLKAR